MCSEDKRSALSVFILLSSNRNRKAEGKEDTANLETSVHLEVGVLYCLPMADNSSEDESFAYFVPVPVQYRIPWL